MKSARSPRPGPGLRVPTSCDSCSVRCRLLPVLGLLSACSDSSALQLELRTDYRQDDVGTIEAALATGGEERLVRSTHVANAKDPTSVWAASACRLSARSCSLLVVPHHGRTSILPADPASRHSTIALPAPRGQRDELLALNVVTDGILVAVRSALRIWRPL